MLMGRMMLLLIMAVTMKVEGNELGGRVGGLLSK